MQTLQKVALRGLDEREGEEVGDGLDVQQAARDKQGWLGGGAGGGSCLELGDGPLGN
jgi:hypothetical protein